MFIAIAEISRKIAQKNLHGRRAIIFKILFIDMVNWKTRLSDAGMTRFRDTDSRTLS